MTVATEAEAIFKAIPQKPDGAADGAAAPSGFPSSNTN